MVVTVVVAVKFAVVLIVCFDTIGIVHASCCHTPIVRIEITIVVVGIVVWISCDILNVIISVVCIISRWFSFWSL